MAQIEQTNASYLPLVLEALDIVTEVGAGKVRTRQVRGNATPRGGSRLGSGATEADVPKVVPNTHKLFRTAS